VVTLADTSAIIEFLRASGHPARLAARRAYEEGELAVTDPVVMEVLAGTAERKVEAVRKGLYTLQFLPVVGLADFETAADVFRRCRSSGETVRSMIDCLIAAVAMREDVPVLHSDTDFDVIARHTDLRTVALPG
jgi:predicted nucleic acid-binding protein